MSRASRWLSAVALGLVVSAGGCALGPGRDIAKTRLRLPLLGKRDRVEAASAPRELLGSSDAHSPTSSPVRRAVVDARDATSERIRQVSGTIVEAPFKALSSGFKSGAARVSEAFTPSVREAQDPTSLSMKTAPKPKLFVSMARLAERSGRLEEAEQRYRQALEIDPRDLDALLGYARLKDRQGRLDDAIGFYRQAAEAHPDNATVHNDLGLCLARHKKLREAVAELERAIQLVPKETLYRNNIATVLVEIGDVDAAFGHLTEVHSRAVAYYNVGYLLQKKGQSQSAARLFAEALKIDPSLQQARAWLVRLQGRPATAPAPPQHRPAHDGRLEDLSVEAPDLRSARRQPLIPDGRLPKILFSSPQKHVPQKHVTTPGPRVMPPRAKAAPAPPFSKEPTPRVRQLPPVIESYNPRGAIVPQSYEDAPLPSGANPQAGKTLSSDQPVAEPPADAVPAPLPGDTEAIPLPVRSESEPSQTPAPEAAE